MPFFPYAPYQPQTEMSTADGHFSRRHSEQLPTVEEDAPEDGEVDLEDNERVSRILVYCLMARTCVLHSHQK